MGLLTGKRGVIMGVANERSIATAVARLMHKEGAELGFSYLPDTGDRNRNEQRVRDVTKDLNPKIVASCDVAQDQDIQAFFAQVQEAMGTIDFVIHSIAYAPTEDLKCPTYQASRSGFASAMDISVYSFLAVARYAAPIMNQNGTGSICAMTYFGGEKVMPGYNLMGVAKAALDASVRYTASELGALKIRVNAISAGPVKTLAASAVGDFKKMLSLYENTSPLRSNITAEDVGAAAAFLASDYGRMTTGEILHVDGGYHVMGVTRSDDA
ncbi:MAG: enoyl-ACP reductase [Proteobacteria bacterium]|nr:MAG: enoyl-ACP reductase [Pseudomonadota bacterium]